MLVGEIVKFIGWVLGEVGLMRGGVAANGSCGFLLFYVSFSELNVVFPLESREAADIEP